MAKEKVLKAEITDYPKGVFVDVECPYCSAIQEVDAPLDDEAIIQCQEDNCQEKIFGRYSGFVAMAKNEAPQNKENTAK